MDSYLTGAKKASIGNAIKSLYQLIVLVEEGSLSCHLVDCNKELDTLNASNVRVYDDLFSSLYKNTHPEDRNSLLLLSNIDDLNKALSGEVYISCECRIRHTDLGYYWSRITICNAKVEDSPTGHEYLILLEDVHTQKNVLLADRNELLKTISTLEDKYNKLFIENMTDAQTGCYNRKGLKYSENIALQDTRDNNKDIFVCVLDLNGLKYMNDTFGHSAGDTAIATVADALQKAAPKGSSIIRTGGDEFLVFCPLEKDSTEYESFGTVLESELNDYNASHDNPFEVSASYGYVFLPLKEGMDTLDEYIEVADEKMYRMKEETDPHKR
ncbi:MAG: GGDEF domain-containing protein [Butyrivibrio sp.]|uniref:sensor domain-containing diguanylate cyclase n=1 Tax=Butyrivibrio sp. TaxID=28121 RepID=UPI001B17D786|nr:sensor domain-containing diguanylate cyclase [Butyrivibrio sp.]MBO5622600.1 GGDEF domain-containing protein [Butyrivibrio sp.]MBP3783222.1 GGDEF domain-containing protein [Butyrivibrio sp.]